MDPIRLQKQLRDNNTDLQDYFKDIKEWGAEMKRKETALKSQQSFDEEKQTQTKMKKVNERTDKRDKSVSNSTPTNKKKSVKEKDEVKCNKVSKDYKFWENFDVEAECEKVDQEKSDDSDLSDEFDDSILQTALEEKEKGNELVKNGLYTEAIQSYTKAIKVYSYDATFYANRALCYLKLNQPKNAESDCTTALQIDNEYVKAYHRRATAREALGQLNEAQKDLQHVLEFDPTNSESKKFLEKVNRKLQENNKNEESEARFESKFMQSRKKSEKSKTVKTVESKPIIEAIKEHIYERKMPEPEATTSNSNIIKNTKSSISWPGGDNIKLIMPIIKTPKDRSKLPLKRLEVRENNQKNKIIQIENMKCLKLQNDKKESIKTNESNEKCYEKYDSGRSFHSLDISVDLSKEDFTKLNISPPKTAVEFNNHWKLFKEPKMKYLYLRQIQPSLYPNIFKEALDSKLFSDIIDILADQFISNNLCVFNYLYGLTKVRRFSTLIMFANSNDKKAIFHLFESIKINEEGVGLQEIEFLKKLYEI